METAGEPDTTSKNGRQMNCYKGKQMNWRHAESPARHAVRGDKWVGDIAERHQPDWETNGLIKRETNELEISGEPDTTSKTGRQMNCYKGRQMNWRHPESRTPQARLAVRGDKLIGDIRRDTTSQTGRQMNCFKGRQMNWRHAESPTPPARLGDKWIAIRKRQINWRHPESRTPPARLGDKWIAI